MMMLKGIVPVKNGVKHRFRCEVAFGEDCVAVEVPAGTLVSYRLFQKAVLQEHGRWFADFRVCEYRRPSMEWRELVARAMAEAAVDEN